MDIVINGRIRLDKKLYNLLEMTDGETKTALLFNRLMIKGKVRDAMNCLSDGGRAAILHYDAKVVST